MWHSEARLPAQAAVERACIVRIMVHHSLSQHPFARTLPAHPIDAGVWPAIAACPAKLGWAVVTGRSRGGTASAAAALTETRTPAHPHHSVFRIVEIAPPDLASSRRPSGASTGTANQSTKRFVWRFGGQQQISHRDTVPLGFWPPSAVATTANNPVIAHSGTLSQSDSEFRSEGILDPVWTDADLSN